MTTSSPITPPNASAGAPPTTMVAVHGAWSSAWAWKKMRPRLADHGVTLVTPTHTGLGERSHLARPEVDLEAHITDVVQVFDYEDLHDVVLVAHSYGGMVATGVLWRIPERIRAIVYLDAMVPGDGQCVLDLLGPAAREGVEAQVRDHGEGWKVPPNPLPPDTPDDDVAWITPRSGFQPFATFTQPIRLDGPAPQLPRTYVYCQRSGPGDVFRQFADRARDDDAWRLEELDASHSPHVTAPDLLTPVLLRAC